jgi:hypothetical protein
MLEEAGFRVRRTFGDGMWDVPYIRIVPSILQLPVFGLPAIIQTLTCVPMIPVRYSESLIAIAEKPRSGRAAA